MARRADILRALVFLVIPSLLFLPVLTGDRIFDDHDLWAYFYPYRQVGIDVIRSGHLPLWNPYPFGGFPLLGDGQTALLFPLNWLALFMAVPHAVSLAVVLQFGLAGIAMYLFTRELGLSPAAAMLAGLAFSLNGFLVARIAHPSIHAGVAMVPLILWGTECVLRRGTLGAVLTLAVAVALQAFTGHPQIPIYTALTVAIYSFITVVMDRSVAWRRLVLVSIGGLLGGALAAVQLLPWMELTRFSPRLAGVSTEFIFRDSMSGWDWVLYLFPYAFGGTRESWMQTAGVLPRTFYYGERFAYIGLMPLALAIVGVISGFLGKSDERLQPAAANTTRRARIVALAVPAILLLLITAGDHTPLGWAIYRTPVIGKLRNVTRAAGVVGPLLAALAGFGADAILQRRDRATHPQKIIPLVGLLVPIAVIAVLITLGLKPPETHFGRGSSIGSLVAFVLRIGQANAYVPLGLAILTATTLIFSSVSSSRFTPFAIGAVILIDLGGLASTYPATEDPAVYERVPPAVAFLHADTETYRVYADFQDQSLRLNTSAAQDQLAPSWSLVYHVREVNGFNSLEPRRHMDLLFGTDFDDISYGYAPGLDLLRPDSALAGMFAVKYAITPMSAPLMQPPWDAMFSVDNVRIYRRKDALPFAHFVLRVIPENDPSRILARVISSSFDPAEEAVVECAADDVPSGSADPGSSPHIGNLVATPGQVELQMNPTTDRFLVVSESWFPGWRGEVRRADGTWQPAAVKRTDYMFCGMTVPAGFTAARLVYRPNSVLIGTMVSVATAIGCCLAFAGARWRRKPGQIACSEAVRVP